MTILTYADPGNLPAPTGLSTTQSFTDIDGEIWVAKSTVLSGAWRKAREVLHAVRHHVASYTPTTSPGALLQFDTLIKDTYGMYQASPWYGYQVPVGGWYKVVATCQGTSSVANSYLQGWIQQNTGVSNATLNQLTSDNQITPQASGGISWRSQGELFLVANDIVNAKVYVSGTANPLTAQGQGTRLEISFLGPG